jgi:hypothetical protein
VKGQNGRKYENLNSAYPLVFVVGDVLAAGFAPAFPLSATLANLASLSITGIYSWLGFQVH